MRILCEPLKITSYGSSPQFTPPYRTGRVKPFINASTQVVPLNHSLIPQYVLSASCSAHCADSSNGMEEKTTQFLLLRKIQTIKREATKVEESMVEISREMPAKLYNPLIRVYLVFNIGILSLACPRTLLSTLQAHISSSH